VRKGKQWEPERSVEYMDILGSAGYENKKMQNRIFCGLRTWYCIYMEDRDKRHRDRARLKQNNKLLKALIKHHKIDMPVLAGSEEDWSDLVDEGDVFATDDENGGGHSSPAEATTDTELGDEDCDDPSI